MARKFNYRGKDAEEIKTMSLEQFMKLIGTKERRTLTRMSPKIKLFRQKFRARAKKGKTMKTHVREMVILPEMLGSKIAVYNGKMFNEVYITTEMLGRRLGEFSHTIKLVRHSGPGIGATRGSKSVELK